MRDRRSIGVFVCSSSWTLNLSSSTPLSPAMQADLESADNDPVNDFGLTLPTINTFALVCTSAQNATYAVCVYLHQMCQLFEMCQLCQLYQLSHL